MNIEYIAQVVCFFGLGAMLGQLYAMASKPPKTSRGNYAPRLLADNQFFQAMDVSEIFQVSGKKLPQEFTTCLNSHAVGCTLKFFVRESGGIQAVFFKATKEKHYVDSLKAYCKGSVCVEMFWCEKFEDVESMLTQIAERTWQTTTIQFAISAVAKTCLSVLPQVESDYNKTLAELKQDNEQSGEA